MEPIPVEIYIADDPIEGVMFCCRAKIGPDTIETCGPTIDGASRKFSRAVREWKDNQETLEIKRG